MRALEACPGLLTRALVPPPARKTEIPRESGTTGCMQPICTYELRFVRERSLTSCLVMAPIVTRRAHEMRRLSGAGLGIDTDSEVRRVYEIYT